MTVCTLASSASGKSVIKRMSDDAPTASAKRALAPLATASFTACQLADRVLESAVSRSLKALITAL